MNSPITSIITHSLNFNSHICSFASNIAHNVFMFNYKSWIVDTRATDHITCSLHFFISHRPNKEVTVQLPNNVEVVVTHIGKV